MNSSGKSSVIQALRIIDRIDTADYKRDKTLKISELPGHGHYGGLRSQEASSEDHRDISFSIENHHGARLNFSIDGYRCEISGNPRGCQGSSKTTPKETFPPTLYYIGADRLGPQVSLNQTSEPLAHVGEHGQNSYGFLADRETNSVYPPVVENTMSLRLAVDTWMSRIAPGSEILAQHQDQIDISSITVNGYRPTNVGFGIGYSLPIVVSLLAYARKPDPKNDKPDALLCIENPEAHLHPGAQTGMGELIARCAASGTSIIIETHSEHLIDGIRIAVKKNLLDADRTRIYFFEYNSGVTSVESLHIDSRGDIDRWPEGFFDQFMINGRELLQ